MIFARKENNMSKILFATSNPSKLRRFDVYLNDSNVELVGLKDLGITDKAEETGKTALENARIKAKFYYEKTGMLTMAMDDNLFIEGISAEEQPGTHVRRVNGKELSDDEMIEYYSNLAHKYGGKLNAKWVYGLVIYDGKEMKEISWDKGDFYMVDKVAAKRNPGYPLNSVSIYPEFNKYFVDMTPEENEQNKRNQDESKVANFIKSVVNEEN